MPAKRTAKKKATPLSNQEIATLAKEYKSLDLKSKALAQDRDKIKPQILEAMEAAKTQLIETDSVRVVYSQQEYVDYDEAGLWAGMTAAQRRVAFDVNFNINALELEERAELLKAMRELLTPSQRRRCTTNVLNVDKLAAAVLAQVIPTELVAEWSEVKKKAAYPTITLK